LLAASGGLIGARVAYVALHWTFYRRHLMEGIRLWAGGLAWQGGLVLGLLLVALYGVRFRLSLGRLFDSLTPGLAWFTLFLWLGSRAANDVYGRETFPTDGFLWSLSADLPDLYGLRAPRVNVPLIATLWSGLVLVAMWLLKDRLRVSGSLFFTFLALTGLCGMVVVPLQANAVPFLLHVRLDWLFYLTITICGLAGLVVVRKWTSR
jgi:prolipoprotein diacylglyceryltransferase